MTDVLDVYRDCSFCLKLLYEPVSILCGHTFCLLCMERFLRSSVDQPLQFPICRDDLTYLRSSATHLKSNATLHNLFRAHYADEYEARRLETETERKQTIGKRLIVGNTHRLLTGNQGETQHQWSLFVRFHRDVHHLDIGEYIRKVTVNLHPTFTPAQVVLEQAPFVLTRIGW